MTRRDALMLTAGVAAFCVWSTVCTWVGYHSAKHPENALLTAPEAFACVTAILTLVALVIGLWHAAERPAASGDEQRP